MKLSVLHLLLIGFFVGGASACSDVTEEVTPPALDKKALEKAEELYCTEGEKSVEDRSSLNVTFDKLIAKSDIFAFSNSNGECALTEDIDQNWPSDEDPLSFKLKIHQDCLPNNSIWIAKDETPVPKPTPTPAPSPTPAPGPPENRPNVQKRYVLRNVASANVPAMEMIGSANLAGNYVGGLTGLRILVCQVQPLSP